MEMEMDFECIPGKPSKRYDPPEFLIPDMLPNRGVVLVVGKGGSYKTSLVMNWLYRLKGPRYERDDGKPGVFGLTAAMLIREAGDQTREAWESYERAGAGRVRWEEDAFFCGGHVYITAPRAFDITDPEQVDAWLDYLDANDEEFGEIFANGPHSGPPVFVVDSLSTCMVGHDENTAATMSKALAGLKRLSKHPEHFPSDSFGNRDALVIAIHHPGKGNDDPRGSGALLADVDVVLRVSESKGIVTVKCTRARGFPVGKTLRYRTRVETESELKTPFAEPPYVVQFQRVEFDELPEDTPKPKATPPAPARATDTPPTSPASPTTPATAPTTPPDAPQAAPAPQAPAHPATRLRGRAAKCWEVLELMALPAGGTFPLAEAKALCTSSPVFADVPSDRVGNRWQEVVAALSNKGLVDATRGVVMNPSN